jgi:hypothetical protein
VSVVVRALGHAIRVEVTDAGSARDAPHVVDTDMAQLWGEDGLPELPGVLMDVGA